MRRQYISKEIISELSKVSYYRGILQILIEYSIIAMAIIFAISFGTWWAYIISIFVIGARQHALGVLGHDAAHIRIFPNRKVNDFLGEAFLFWPILGSLRSYKEIHIKHHNFLNTDEDPSYTMRKYEDRFQMPKRNSSMIKIIFECLVGINFVRELKHLSKIMTIEDNSQLKRKLLWGRRIYWFTIIASAFYFGFLFELVVLWFVPYITTFTLFMYIRGITEHLHLELDDELTNSRVTYPSMLEAFFIVPLNISYHLDHHLYPSVPFYNAKKLHKHLLQNPVYREKVKINRGYFDLLFRQFATPIS